MSHEIEALQRFYRQCDEAHPPAEIAARPRSLRVAFRLMLALAPISIGFAVAAGALQLSEHSARTPLESAQRSILNRQFQSAGLLPGDAPAPRPKLRSMQGARQWPA